MLRSIFLFFCSLALFTASTIAMAAQNISVQAPTVVSENTRAVAAPPSIPAIVPPTSAHTVPDTLTGTLANTPQQTVQSSTVPVTQATIAGLITSNGTITATPETKSPKTNLTLTESLQNMSSLFAWDGYFKAIALLFFFLSILWFMVWALKRKKYGSTGGPVPTMHVESRLALAPKKWVVITRFQNKRFILGMTEQHISMLAELDANTDSVTLNTSDGNLSTEAFATFLQKPQT